MSPTRSLLLTLAVVAGCSNRPEVITLPPPAVTPGQMAVTGTATLQVSPDCADLTMAIAVEGARPGAATTGLATRQAGVVKALGALGVTGADLKLSNLTISPVYEALPNQPSRLRGYRAEVTLTATTRAFDKIGAMMEAGADAGVTSMSTEFRRSDLSTLKAQLRDQAITAARAKATQTASGLGIKLGRVVAVSESMAEPWQRSPYMAQASNVAESQTSNEALGGAAESQTLSVTVTYELPSS
jgi:uncharacterized protein YggE